ncbi:PP2C family protein-serine/threonine phosphatase [Acidobacteriota bacterium]
MNNLRLNGENVRNILSGVIGVILIVLYFLLISRSPLVRFLYPNMAKQEILADAASFYKGLPVDLSRFRQDVSPKINKNLLRYAQYYRGANGKFPELSVGYWDIIWQDERTPESNPESSFYVRYDFNDNLIEFRKREKDLELGKAKNLSEDDAHLEAIYFLESLNIDTKSLIIANKEINEKGEKIKYRFILKNKLRIYPGLSEKYTVEILGSRINYFRLDQTYDPQVTGDLEKDYSRSIAEIVMYFTWVTLCFIIIAQFIRKLRRDELEFKRAFGLEIMVAAALFFLLFLKGENNIKQILIAGTAAGVFGAVGILIIYPAAESLCRQAWPEKLAVSDLLFRGKVWMRETGASILHAFLITGVTLLFFGGLILLTTSLNIGNLSIPSQLPGAFKDLSHVTFLVLKNLIISLFVGFIVLAFWPGYIKTRFQGKAILIMLLSLTFVFAGLHTLFFRPAYLSFLLMLPIALMWSIIVLKFDLLTVLLSLFGVNFFLDLALISLTPESLFRLPGMVVIVSTAFIFLLGVYLIFRPKSARDYDDYVPEYVSRIAEKERILKELEIARSVQMRFLPQQVPESPDLEIVSLCQPAMEVGGNYYDFIQLDERYMSILIGDVSGKGVSAAFYMTIIKGIIKTLAREIRKPADLLAEANDIFYENAARDTFVTIIYDVFDLQKRTLTIASAGHNPLIVYKHKKRKTELYNPGGIAIGFRKGDAYKSIIKEKTIPIDKGDIFVFYTDGVTEAMNTKLEIFGERRLKEVIEQCSQLPPREVERRIIEAVKGFSGDAPQHDDFTMVIVKVK